MGSLQISSGQVGCVDTTVPIDIRFVTNGYKGGLKIV
jgi:hypothetical protein